jgi:hypothetical protein
MGLDILYQAIPDSTELLNFVQQNNIEYCLKHIQFWEGLLDEDDPLRTQFQEILSKTLVKHPNLEKRNFLTRGWDILLYFLSEERRASKNAYDGTDSWHLIILGSTDPYSHPPHYLSPQQVQELAKLLKDSSISKAFFDTQVMKAHEVYKIGQHEQTEEAFQWIVAEFDKLKRLYFDASKYGEGLLIDKS